MTIATISVLVFYVSFVVWIYASSKKDEWLKRASLYVSFICVLIVLCMMVRAAVLSCP